MKVAVLASGGKDSTYASWWALMQGWSIEAMITVKIVGDDSMMFQLQNTEIAQYQAKSIGVKWINVISQGVEDKEIDELEDTIRNLNQDLDAIVVGALRSDYQKTRLGTPRKYHFYTQFLHVRACLWIMRSLYNLPLWETFYDFD